MRSARSFPVSRGWMRIHARNPGLMLATVMCLSSLFAIYIKDYFSLSFLPFIKITWYGEICFDILFIITVIIICNYRWVVSKNIKVYSPISFYLEDEINWVVQIQISCDEMYLELVFFLLYLGYLHMQTGLKRDLHVGLV